MHRILIASLVIAPTWLMSGTAIAACGCSAMRVAFGGTQTICSNNDLDFPECGKAIGGGGTACPATAFVYSCPTGANNLRRDPDAVQQQTGFKITTTYAADSTAAECAPGQILQEIITSEGAPETNPLINPTSLDGAQTFNGLDVEINNVVEAYPRVGAEFGATRRQYFGGDNYVNGAVDVISHQSDTGAEWWDNPDQTKDDDDENATWTFRFLSFVKGSGGGSSCSCEFDISVDWPGGETPATDFTAVAAGSENCN